ncbi:MAG: menaquinone biosynthesis decarboxylase [Bacteroidia bacterium]|nr:menaquinone biosynthesis decarboxylase [Bacteroidia bacterium]
MAFNSLNEFIHLLEKENELLRISHFADPVLEITEITDRISKLPGGGKALLFENNGTGFPVLMNALGSEKRICLALGIKKLDDIATRIDTLFREISSPKSGLFDKLKMLPALKEIASWLPRSVSGRGKCQEIIENDPDVEILPVLKCWPFDGGRFFTLPVVITTDPVTGLRNVGMYRMQVYNRNLTAMHWHRHKTGARHFEEYKKAGRRMPVAVALGGDLSYTYAATAPLPDNLDEFLFAGFLRNKKVDLVKCISIDSWVPSDADIIIEGYIDPKEELILEGPFGDHTGFYSLPDLYPRFHITCITHRKDAVYPATIVGIPPQEDAYIAKATERIFLAPIRLALLPEVADIDVPDEGVAHNMTVVKINKSYPGQAVKVINSLWGAGQMMLNKIMLVVSDDIDIHDYINLTRKAIDNYNPATDTCFSRGPLDVLDHSAGKMSYGGKLGIDATLKLPEEEQAEHLNISGKIENLPDLPDLIKRLGIIGEINQELSSAGIPVLIISVNKTKEFNAARIAEEILSNFKGQHIKIVVFADKEVDIFDYSITFWYVTNNIDPTRDCQFISPPGRPATLCIDGTRKSKDNINFFRDWPNVIVSSDETIRKVDAMWDQLGIGKFIISPSLKYKVLVNGAGATSEDT